MTKLTQCHVGITDEWFRDSEGAFCNNGFDYWLEVLTAFLSISSFSGRCYLWWYKILTKSDFNSTHIVEFLFFLRKLYKQKFVATIKRCLRRTKNINSLSVNWNFNKIESYKKWYIQNSIICRKYIICNVFGINFQNS